MHIEEAVSILFIMVNGNLLISLAFALASTFPYDLNGNVEGDPGSPQRDRETTLGPKVQAQYNMHLENECN